MSVTIKKVCLDLADISPFESFSQLVATWIEMGGWSSIGKTQLLSPNNVFSILIFSSCSWKFSCSSEKVLRKGRQEEEMMFASHLNLPQYIFA